MTAIADSPSPLVRLVVLEERVEVLARSAEDTRAALSGWTRAIVVAMIGAFVTVLLAGAVGLVAYGRLEEQAATSARLLAEVRAELAEIRRELR